MAKGNSEAKEKLGLEPEILVLHLGLPWLKPEACVGSVHRLGVVELH